MFRFYFGIVLGVFLVAELVVCDLICYNCGPEDASCYNPSASENTKQKPCSRDDNLGFQKELWQKGLETGVTPLQEGNDDQDFDCYSVVYTGDKHPKGIYRGCMGVREGISACDIINEEYRNDTVKEGCASCKTTICNSNIYPSVEVDSHRQNDDGSAANIRFTFSLAFFACLFKYLL